MSTNPYAHPEPYEPEYVEPSRVSGMAITSLVLSLICCIPGVSLIGAILGGVSLVTISASRGRLSGRGLAIAGLIFGLLFTFLWFGIGIGTVRTMQELTVYGESLRALEQRDYNRVRQVLDANTSAAATDERLEEFRDAIEAEWGSFVRMPQGIGEWVGAWGQVLEMMAQYQQTQPRGQIRPVPIFYDGGVVLAIFTVDPWDTGPLGVPLASEVVVFDRQGNPIHLLPPPPPVGVPAPPLPPEAPPVPPEDPEAPGDAERGGS